MITNKQAFIQLMVEFFIGLVLTVCFVGFFWVVAALGKIWDERHQLKAKDTVPGVSISTDTTNCGSTKQLKRP